MALKIEYRKVADLTEYPGNARLHSEKQVDEIAASITKFGFNIPISIDDSGEIIAGHGRLMAAKKLGMDEVPCVTLGHLSPAQRRAYVIADNKIALNSEWDIELLTREIQELKGLEIDVSDLGFSDLEISEILGERHEHIPKHGVADFNDQGVGYKEQFGVIVICSGEAEQKEVYDSLVASGKNCRIVVT